MEYKVAPRRLSGVELLNKIIPQITDWDFEVLEGVGYYRKGEHYGHVELKIYATKELQSFTKIIWNIEEHQIPEDIRNKIKIQLEFFYNLLISLKGCYLNLTIEINNGSFHPIDSYRYGFSYATIYALIDCFDESFNWIGDTKKTIIKDLQNRALERLKYETISFSNEIIINSLKNIGVNNVIRNIVLAKNHLMLDHYIQRFGSLENREMFTRFLLEDVSDEAIENLKGIDIISQHNILTNIGLAHVALILKQKRIFNLLDIKDLKSLHGYYDISFI